MRVVGEVGTVTVDGSPLNFLCFNNDVGGTSELPEGIYRVLVERTHHGGSRGVGVLVDEADIEIARVKGTTGFAPEGTTYRPTAVYFMVSRFVPEGRNG